MAAGGAEELKRSSCDWDGVVAEIVKIEKRLFPKHESLARTFDEELRKKNAGLLYLRVNGEVAGYVMFSWPSSLSASITKLAVKDSYQRQGHGEALLRAAIQKCRTRNVHRVQLHVDPSRSPALSLYKKLGFEVDSLIDGYYSSDRDAYRMFLDFDGDG
ncbi:uncharacterized protein LOC116204498 [Punica granatum]|uniref:N-acetyltransferase domain-containing protein n=2 Tax=Punica granatum TaxID=22663 RepID=A0A218Y2G0_PUNGR|nr:uncharacterized protein LOC116204498 [Punica granatum]OWM91021.1 hypothetical protein CDL15_Pgr023354 [Punica granatum]PKI54624.1 hypothetical protein CRG98_024975 [Punica granatum]